MKSYYKYSLDVREKVFMFAGLTDNGESLVTTLLDGDTYVLKDDVLYTTGNDAILPHETERFNNGFYLGHGCLGNGTVYWDKRNKEFGDFKIIGQITDDKQLIIRTDEKVLIDFLKEEARPNIKIKAGGK